MMPKVELALPKKWLDKIDTEVKDESTPVQNRAEVIRKALSDYLYPVKPPAKAG